MLAAAGDVVKRWNSRYCVLIQTPFPLLLYYRSFKDGVCLCLSIENMPAVPTVACVDLAYCGHFCGAGPGCPRQRRAAQQLHS